ncbi:MAG TPA: radical SAM/SPASM domain-containing protein [Steroidobacteraceae bacterium]|nr:radical SAM/SPASM domain-containing protein [Steroidobacteraceae bacterium]
MASYNGRTSLERLPLVTLFLSERCNSRCVSCDYWRHGRVDLDLEAVNRLLPSLERLGTEVVLISGGEPLLNPEWQQIAAVLGQQGLKVWLLTSGLSLAKHASRASMLFDAITVSLDGTDSGTYAAIRGVDAFDVVCRGVRAAVGANAVVTLRVTVQRGNFRQLPGFVELARELGVAQVSFLAVDVANSHAFKRHEDFAADLALRAEDLPELQRILVGLERDHAEDFRTGFIAENPEKLRRQLLAYFTAVCGLGRFPPVRCNAPEFSAVIDARRHVSPCFFIGGPHQAVVTDDLGSALDGEDMIALRASIRRGERAECSRCVCSIWRDPGHVAAADRELLPMRRGARQ